MASCGNVAACDGCGVSSRGVDDGADCNERPSHRRLSGILFSVLSAIVIR